MIVLQDIFTFQQTGIESGKIVGRMKPTASGPSSFIEVRGSQHLSAAEHLWRRDSVLVIV